MLELHTLGGYVLLVLLISSWNGDFWECIGVRGLDGIHGDNYS